MVQFTGARTANEKNMLETAYEIENALLTKVDWQVLEKYSSPNVTLHKDSITLLDDIKGVDAVKNYFETYHKKYKFEHHLVELAANDSNHSVFTLSYDKDVTPKPDAFPEKLPSDAMQPSNTIAIYKYLFDSSTKLTDIFYFRQLSKDEIYRKLQKPIDTSSLFNKLNLDSNYMGQALQGESIDVESKKDRAMQVAQAAKTYSGIWTTGDPSPADHIMAEDARQVSLLHGTEMTGRKSFKDMITNVFKEWDTKSTHDDIAVSPCTNKAFIHWSSRGEETKEGVGNNLKGMNVLKFNDKNQIVEILGFRQPLATERSEFLKAES